MHQNSGNLVITACNAQLKRDTEFFGKMDPYVKFQLGSQVLKTKEAKDMGKAPKWDQQLNARVQGEQLITFDLFDKDIGKDEYIAQGSYALTKLFQCPGQSIQEAVPLQYKGKAAGTINLRFQFYPDQQQQKQGFNQPQQQFQQGGFNQPQQPGFNQPQQQGFNQPQQHGFNQPQQHGFNQPQQQGFNQPQQQGFNQPQQQGFNNPMGGFNQPQQQQGFNQQGQPGQYPTFNQPQQGFNQPQQHGFNQPQQGFNQPQQGFNQPQQGNGRYPMVKFNPSCGKCHGSGQNKKKNNGNPCGQCYQDAGYCKKCCGSMWDIKKNKRCEKCQNGRASSNDKKKKDKKKK